MKMFFLIAREVDLNDDSLVMWWDDLDDSIMVDLNDDAVPNELVVLATYERAAVTKERLQLVLDYAKGLQGFDANNPPFSVSEDDSWKYDELGLPWHQK